MDTKFGQKWGSNLINKSVIFCHKKSQIFSKKDKKIVDKRRQILSKMIQNLSKSGVKFDQ